MEDQDLSEPNASSSRTAMIADDHPMVRGALRNVLESLENVKIVAEATNGLEAIAMAKAHRPGLLTLDAGMPLCRGMEVFGEVRRWSPGTKVALVTGFTAAGALADWTNAGVDGVFLKSCEPDELRAGFEALLNGRGFAAQAVLDILADAETEADGGGAKALTPRERQILHLIAEGRTNAEIGERLCISAKTVDNHRTKLMAKLGVHSVAQLLAFALKEGLLDSNSQL